MRHVCSPIGMRKRLPTYIHSTAMDHEAIYVSAGVRGLQIRIAPNDLLRFVGAQIAPISHRMEE